MWYAITQLLSAISYFGVSRSFVEFLKASYRLLPGLFKLFLLFIIVFYTSIVANYNESMIFNEVPSQISYFNTLFTYVGLTTDPFDTNIRLNSKYQIAAIIIHCFVLVQKLTYILILFSFAVVYLKKSLSLQSTDEMNPEKQKLFSILDNIYSNTEKFVNKTPKKDRIVTDESVEETKEKSGILCN
jgi:hypothetical protein